MLPSIRNGLVNFYKYRYLLKELVSRELKVKYKRSILGVLWSLLNPFFNMIILTLVFSTIFKSKIPNFPVYFLCGSVLFTFFSDATSQAMYSVYTNGSLIRKVYIPKYMFPLSKVVFGLVNLLFSLIAVLVVMIATRTEFHLTILMFFLPVLYLFFFSVGVGLILSSAAVFFRDLTHIYGIFLTALNFLTPIFYPLDILPKRIMPLIELNPLYKVITMLREMVLLNKLPAISDQLYIGVFTLVTLMIGLFIFYKKQDEFILYI